jgi:predicted dienelactone hydrolase
MRIAATAAFVQVFGRRHEEASLARRRPASKNLHNKRRATSWRPNLRHVPQQQPLASQKGIRHCSGALMQVLATFLCAALSFAAMPAQSAGVRFFDIPADTTGRPLTGAVWYPCSVPQQEVTVRNRAIQGKRDCPLIGDKLPLVVISHGRGGWFGGHHATAAPLADAGFIVAAIDHPGNNELDQSRVDQLSVLIERPDDIKRLVDFMLLSWEDGARIDRDRIGLFGFSMGGYTGLVIVGGNPDFRNGLPGCQGSDFRACEELRSGEAPVDAPAHDERIKAAVIADPAPSFFFPTTGLKTVNVPLQLWSSDPKLAPNYVSGCCGLGIRSRLPSSPDFHLVPNAIHFSFLSPCSPAEVKDFPRICVDAPGFDRAAFHKDFNAAVLAFFRKHLLGL